MRWEGLERNGEGQPPLQATLQPYKHSQLQAPPGTAPSRVVIPKGRKNRLKAAVPAQPHGGDRELVERWRVWDPS